VAKKITRSALIGDQGIALVHRRAGQLGFVWTQGSNLDAGIDGLLEIRDDVTGVVTNSVIQVQSKATEGRFTAETDTTLEFLCDERDLNYWMQGNAPVILVVSRPKDDEAYYVSVKDYFRDPGVRATRRVRFDKRRDRFDVGARQALIDIALPRERGVYFAPPPKEETLVANLLPVLVHPPTILVGGTALKGRDIRDTLTRHQAKASEWFVRGGRVIAVHDLREPPWDDICDQGTVEYFEAAEWAVSDDPVRQAEFAELLYSCLAVKLHGDLRYNRKEKLFTIKPSDDFSSRYLGGTSGRQGRNVFKAYFKKTDGTKTAYCRHSAFKAHFARLGDRWYLSVTPTYHFTSDGWWPSRRGGEFLSNAKRRERNDSVRQQLEMWARYLTGVADYTPPDYPLLVLGPPLAIEVDAGIDDKAWLRQDDEPVEGESGQAAGAEEAA
jgi:Domain of unknown function (DUF4365)